MMSVIKAGFCKIDLSFFWDMRRREYRRVCPEDDGFMSTICMYWTIMPHHFFCGICSCFLFLVFDNPSSYEAAPAAV
jgi:hypothetical protein